MLVLSVLELVNLYLNLQYSKGTDGRFFLGGEESIKKIGNLDKKYPQILENLGAGVFPPENPPSQKIPHAKLSSHGESKKIDTSRCRSDVLKIRRTRYQKQF